MPPKKKLTSAVGFLLDTESINNVNHIAEKRGLKPSDIYREAMKIYISIQNGTAILTTKAAEVPDQVSVTPEPSPVQALEVKTT